MKKLLIIAAILVLTLVILVWSVPVLEPQRYGITFSQKAAEAMGYQWDEVYVAMLHELGVRHIRLAAYWDEIEAEKGTFNFEILDQQLREAGKVGAEVIVAVGRKVPRWPECHIPGWASELSLEDQDEAVLRYIEAVVKRYRTSQPIVMWQVENEPFLLFGECPDFTAAQVDREIELVRSLDASRPILVTDSGELSFWVRAAMRGDVFGTTMYRRVNNRIFGQFEYPLPPSFFRLKRAITEFFIEEKPMLVIELQGEPWIGKALQDATIEEQYAVMDPEYFNDTLRYAHRSGFDTFYLWGVEWWYWLRERGHPEIWEIVKEEIARLEK